MKYEHLLLAPPNEEEACSSNDGIRILVPLCGKSVDMTYLANHQHIQNVVGIDGVKVALGSTNPYSITTYDCYIITLY